MRLAQLLLAAVFVVGFADQASAKTKAVEAASYGASWPFTVRRGVLSCQDVTKAANFSQQAVLFSSGGVTYALNGSAMTAASRDKKNWVNARQITKFHPDGKMYGLMSTAQLIQEGLKLCKR
jgi:hypothetical protein